MQKNLRKKVSKYLGIITFSFFLTTKAFSFCIFFCDPDLGGCVYDNDGNKISCVSGISFNEKKSPGSLKRAEQHCMSMLQEDAYEKGVSNFSIEGCFDNAPR
tara:strand:- start:227 stop:532 length:306 start_codon:yes stop_codon:yes gene_type:complete